MSWNECAEFPAAVNPHKQEELAGVRDDRTSSPLTQLTYRRAERQLDGDAFVVLPSGRLMRIRDYRESVGYGGFGVYFYTDTGEAAGVLDEFLREAGLDRENVMEPRRYR